MTSWHVAAMMSLGFAFVDTSRVEALGTRDGAGPFLIVPAELVLAFDKAG